MSLMGRWNQPRINKGTPRLRPGRESPTNVKDSGCVPLGERELRIPDKRMALVAATIMVGAISLVTFGLLPAAAAFTLGVLASMVLRTVPLRQIYTSVDWPVVVLLAALIPVAGAMQSTGAAEVLARFLVDTVAQGNAIAALVVVLVVAVSVPLLLVVWPL